MKRPECRRAVDRAWVSPILALSMTVGLIGCASPPPPPSWPRSYVVLLPDASGRVGEVTVEGTSGRTTLRTAGEAAGADGSVAPGVADEQRLQSDFGQTRAARPPLPERFVLYFDPGTTRLTQQSQAELNRIVGRVKERSAQAMVDASVIGHTDTVGRAEVNARLSAERAQSVANLLRQAGLKLTALVVEGHGETNLLVPTPDDTDEPRNRRVEVVLR